MGGDLTRSAVQLRVLGAMAVAVDGHERVLQGPRAARLLTRLVVARGRPVSPWELRAEVWPGVETSDSTLRVTVGRLRSVLGDDGAEPRILCRNAHGYYLDLDLVDVDATRFCDLIDRARHVTDDPARAIACYDQALALWRGTPFDDLPTANGEVERLQSLREEAIEERLALAVAQGQGPELIAELEAAVADQALRERRTALLMMALYRAGRQADALAAYRRLETTLREQLGLSPTDELRNLEVRVVSQDPALIGLAPAMANQAAADGAAGEARAAVALARRGVFDEAIRLASAAVADARRAGDAAAVIACMVGHARVLAAAGRPAESHTVIDDAVALARRTHDGNGLAAAAMARFGFGMAADDTLLVNVSEPLDLLPRDAPARVELLCAAMHQVALTGTPDSAAPLVREALEIASRVGDGRAETVAHIGEAVLSGIRRDPVEVMRSRATRALASAEASGDPVLVVAALHAVLRERMAAGDIDGLEGGLGRFDEAAAEALLPFALVRRLLVRSGIDLARGRTEGVRARVEATIAEGARLGVTSSAGSALAQLIVVMVENDELEAAARALEATAGSPLERVTLAFVLAELGRCDEATDILEATFADGHLPRTGDAAVIGVLAAEAMQVCRWDGVELLGMFLRPEAGRNAVLSYATVTLGPVDRALGLVALRAGDPEAAVASMARAVEVAGSASIWRARSEIGLAHALAVRGGPGDVEEAGRLLHALDGSPLLTGDTRSAWLARQHRRARAAVHG